MSSANQRRGNRRGSTRNSANQENNSLSQAQVERLELELIKFPEPSPYYKKKISTNISKELKISQKSIMQWLNSREKDSKATMVNLKSPIVVKKEMVPPIIAKAVQKTPKSDAEDEIEIIDLDDDDDETLLNESTENNKSMSLGESSSTQKKVENPKEESKTFVRTVKVKSKASGSVMNTINPNMEALKLRISELESKNVDLENQKRDLAVNSKQKYDTLLNEYKNNLENKIGPMIESYKNELKKKEKEITELTESQTKLASSGNQEKALLKQLKEKEQKINLVEQKLKTAEANLKKKEEERIKSLKEMKNSQTMLKSKHEDELTKKEEELEKATTKSLKLKEKFEKTKEELDQKNPILEKEITELKEAHNKLKKELVMKEKELQFEAKEVQKLSKLEEEKKSLAKKISKLEAESLQKNKSIDAFKLKITGLEKDLKSRSSDLDTKQKLFEEENKQIEDRVTELCAVLSKKEDLLKELQQKEESLEEKSLEAKTKLSEVKSKLKEKNVFLRKELEEKNNSVAALKKEVNTLKKERDEKTETISQCKTDLENAKNVINTTISELKKTIDSKDQEISGLETEIQRKVSVFNEKLEAKSVELMEKDAEIEAMSKKFSESKELSEKIKEKQLNIIKLSHTVYEKDSVIAKKEEEIQKLSSRILELGRENERKLEMRSFQEINNQNKLRHELLLQQQEMRKCLEAEIEANKLQVVEEKLQADKRVEEARAEVEEEAAGQRLVLVRRLEERKRLLRKVKMVLLYKASAVVGSEKGSQTSAVKLRLPYNWPLVQQPEFCLTETLQTLLSRPTFPMLKVPNLVRPNLKRKAETVTVQSKRRRVAETCWPVVVYHPRSVKRKAEQPTELAKKFRLELTLVSVLNSPSIDISFPLPMLMTSPKPKEAAPMLMLTYEQPSPIREVDEDDDIGLIEIQCYTYKVTRPAVRARTTGMISPSEKVTARRYRKPSFTPLTGSGKKRSFLEFLETLSSDEMGDFSSGLTDEECSLPDLKIKISPPAKKHRYSRGVVTPRAFPKNMEQMDFYFDFDDSHNICQILVNILLDSVFY